MNKRQMARRLTAALYGVMTNMIPDRPETMPCLAMAIEYRAYMRLSKAELELKCKALPNDNIRRGHKVCSTSLLGFDGENNERMPTDKEALGMAVALIKKKFTGNSDFDKGMRLLQKYFRKHKKPNRGIDVQKSK